MTTIPAVERPARPWYQFFGVVAVALLTFLVWFGWLGWDHEYQLDPATNTYQGPYETWQVVGCAVSLLALLIGALLARVRPALAGSALTLTFTTAWSVNGASSDDSGLWGVGALMLLCGLSAASLVVTALTTALIRRRTA